MDRVEEGVANFRAFTRTVEEFITRADTRDEERAAALKKRDEEVKEAVHQREATQNAWFTLLGLIVAVLALLVGWLTYRDSQRKLGEISPQANHSALQSPVDSQVIHDSHPEGK